MNFFVRQIALTLSDTFPGVYRALRGPLLRRHAVRGMPPGLSLETLEAVCMRQTGERVTEVAHTSLTPYQYRGRGVFRVWVRTTSNARWSAIYKRVPPAERESQETSGGPRLGDVAVYSSTDNELAPFLPDVYWLETPVDERGGYRFLIEDLLATHRRAHRTSEFEGIAARLGEMHRALTRAVSSSEVALPKHDHSFVRKIEADAQDSFERLATTPPMPEGVSRLLGSWEKVDRVLWLDEFRDPEAASAIHGDFQSSHALIPVARRGRAQIGVRFIDWELASWGLPEFDLATLLLETDAARRTSVLETYTATVQRPAAEVNRSYQWCSLVSSLLMMRIRERNSRLADGGRASVPLLEAEYFADRALEAVQQLG